MATRVRSFRVCDRRYPFLWATSDQPPGRWHDAGEGPCHYLSTTAKAAWAEIVRHEEIRNEEDLEDLCLTLWEVDVPDVFVAPSLGLNTLTGGEASYALCRAEARRLRAGGVLGVKATSAALLSGKAEQFACSARGSYITREIPSESLTLFGPSEDVVTMPDAEGHPEPTLLDDVRYL